MWHVFAVCVLGGSTGRRGGGWGNSDSGSLYPSTIVNQELSVILKTLVNKRASNLLLRMIKQNSAEHVLRYVIRILGKPSSHEKA